VRTPAVIVALLLATACSSGQASNTSTSVATTTPPSTTSAPAQPDVTFSTSTEDMLDALNPQLPVLLQGAVALPRTIKSDKVYGGAVTPAVEIYLRSQSDLFGVVRVVTVHVKGTPGKVSTPARLLSGIGVSLYGLAPEAAEAFTRDALPRLSEVTRPVTTITVGTLYDLTVVADNSATLTFVFTPVGVLATPEDAALGR